MRFLKTVLPVAMLFLLSPAQAQISFGGTPAGLGVEARELQAPPVIELPPVDRDAMMTEDAQRMADGVKGPFRFGVNRAVDLGLDNSGTWSTLADGTRIWRVAIHCPEAFSINFEFGEYVVPEGAKVFVYNSEGGQLGAFTAASSGGKHTMGVTQLAGDNITVEYEEPAAVAGQGQLRITQVTHAYRNIMGNDPERALGDSGPCNNNVICPEGDDWRDEIAAVAMITVGGSGICTGTLINNCASDGTPYFLTANHCTSNGSSNVGNWVFRFKWESPTCTPTTNGPTTKTVSGAQLLVNSGGSDVALLQLNTAPPANYNVYYTGWNATGDIPENQTCIHHPQGDIKKISFDNDPAEYGTMSGAPCWHILGWDDGTTEPGSSGSCLLDQDHRIIGQLFGGSASCGNNVDDFFGRFDVSYPLLQPWLGSCATAIDGYDPNSIPSALDVRMVNITGIASNYCNTGVVEPVLNVKNNGSDVITQFTYSYDLDGGAATTAAWTGTLAPGEIQSIALDATTALNGSHVFHASCSEPNGQADGNPVNNSSQRNFTVADPGYPVTVAITTDNYGSETTWSIEEQGGAVLYTGGPYQDTNGGTSEGGSFCLASGCYNFKMMDAYGDGICCQYGNGSFRVLDGNGAVLVDGTGIFSTSITSPFCIGSTGINQEGSIADLQIYPNPGTGALEISMPGTSGEASIRVRDALGREVNATKVPSISRARLDLGFLPNGTYSLDINTGHFHAVRQVIIMR